MDKKESVASTGSESEASNSIKNVKTAEDGSNNEAATASGSSTSTATVVAADASSSVSTTNAEAESKSLPELERGDGDPGTKNVFRRPWERKSGRRNYRNSQNLDSSEEDSDIAEDEPTSTSGPHTAEAKKKRDNTSEAIPMGESRSKDNGRPDTTETNQVVSTSVTEEPTAASLGSPAPALSPADGEDNEPRQNEEDVEPEPPLITDSSDSDSSVHLMDEDVEPDSSSDSSDCILEDLEESMAVGDKDRDSNNESQESSAKKKKLDAKASQELPEVLKKPKPKHSWNGPRELLHRELGYRGRMQPQTAEIFRSRFYGSLFSAERLELMKKLDGHSGCVNCLNFNYAGTKLASGSDDLTIKIWNYGLGKLLTSFQSGHRANVFQAKFLPLIGLDNMIVSCARDNQVRLNELDSTGEVASSRKLAQHKGPAHKLSVHPESPQVILSCGEDSFVYSIDIREDKPQRLVSVREKERKVALYSVHSNPLASYEFCVSGRDEYVRLYDARKLSTSSVPVSQNESVDSSPEENNAPSVRRFCPQHLIDNRAKAHVTAAVYNYNGKEILGSYNDENIYLFDASHSDMADCMKVYEGHRNNATVKGVNFFGDQSQFVISGSDCGHIFIWDKETESIVNFFRGDENGVVNCLEPHPGAPILATSGLDDDVKIWIPSNEKPPKMGDLAATVRRNIKKRKEDLDDHSIDGHMMWALLNHMRRNERQRRRQAGELSGSSSDEDDDEDDDRGAEMYFRNRSNDCRIA